MKKIKYLLPLFTLVLFFMLDFKDVNAEDDVNVLQWETSEGVPIDKEWHIKFNHLVNKNILIDELIYVLNDKNEKVDSEVAYDEQSQSIIVSPPAGGYEKQKSYTLVIEEGLTSTDKVKLKQSIHKKFTTNSERLIEAFVPRADSKNTIEVVDHFFNIELSQMLTNDYDSGVVNITKDEAYKVGDLLYFPETDQYAFGFVGKVTKIIEHPDFYEVHFDSATPEEYIKEIDISQEMQITADEVELSDELVVNDFSDEYRSALKVKNPFAELVSTKNGFIIKMRDVGREFKNEGTNLDEYTNVKGKGGFSLSGEIEFNHLSPHIDSSNPKKVTEFGVSSSQEIRLNASVYGDFVGTMELPLISQGIPNLSVGSGRLKAGLFFDAYLVLRFSADGKVSITIRQGMSQDIGARMVNGQYKPYVAFNRKKLETTVEEAKIKLQFDKGYKMQFVFYIGQNDLAFAGIEPELQSHVTFGQLYENSLKDACYELGVDLYFAAKVGLGKERWTPYSRTHNLTRNTNCAVPNIKFVDREITVNQTERPKLKVIGVLNDKDKTEVSFALPHNNITFTSLSKHVAVDNRGYISISPQAPNDLKTRVKVELRYGGKRYADYIDINVKRDDHSVDDGTIEPVPYMRSFEITNNGANITDVKVERYGHYIVYTSDGKIYSQSISSGTNLRIPAGGKAYLSYLTSINNLPASPENKHINIKEVSAPAYEAYRLYKDSIVTVKSSFGGGRAAVYLEDANRAAGYSLATYEVNQTVNLYRYKDKILNTTTEYIPQYGEMIIKNEKAQSFTVYVPRGVGEVTQTDQDPLIFEDINSGEAIKVTSNEPNNGLSKFTISAEVNKSAFEYLQLKSDGTVLRHTNATNADWFFSSLDVPNSGETFIKNISNVLMTVYGPAKYTTFEKTSEPVLVYDVIQPGETVKVTSNEPNNASSEYSIIAEANNSTFEYLQLRKDGTVWEHSSNKLVGTSRSILRVQRDGETYIKNTSNVPMTVYGPAMYTTFEKTSEPIMVHDVIQPGETVKVTSSQPDLSNSFSISAEANKSTFEYLQLKSDGTVWAHTKERRAGISPSILRIQGGGENYIKNTSNVSMMLNGPAKYIQFEKTTMPPM